MKEEPGVVVHALNLSAQEAERQVDLNEFEGNLGIQI